MKRMLILLACLLVLASPAFSQAEKCYDTIGIYFDTCAIQDCFNTHEPFEQVQAYLAVVRPSCPGISRWQCMVEAGDAVSPSWVLAGNVTTSYLEEQDGFFDVELGLLENALRPVDDVCVLATWTGFVMSPAYIVEFFIEPLPDSTIFPDSPGYLDGKNPDIAVPLGVSSGDFEMPVAQINYCWAWHYAPNEASTWGAAKALFR